MYYLAVHGTTSAETMNVHLNYQRQWLKLLLQDLHLVREVDESDLRLARLGPTQISHYCTKRKTLSDPPRFLDEQLEMLQETTQGIEARLSQIKIATYGAATRSLELVAPPTSPESILGNDVLHHTGTLTILVHAVPSILLCNHKVDC